MYVDQNLLPQVKNHHESRFIAGEILLLGQKTCAIVWGPDILVILCSCLCTCLRKASRNQNFQYKEGIFLIM